MSAAAPRAVSRRLKAGGKHPLIASPLGVPTQWATLGLGSAAGSWPGDRNVNAMATAPRPIAHEPMNNQT